MRIIVTHTSPDWDAIAAAWLLARYSGDDEGTEFAFVNTGNPDQALIEAAWAVVDTGKVLDGPCRRFDHHHLPGDEASKTCSAAQVWEWLFYQGLDSSVGHLLPLVSLVLAGDQGRAPEVSRDLGLHALLSAFKAGADGVRPSDQEVLEFGFGLLDLLDVRLKAQSQAVAELEERVVYRSLKEDLWAIRHGSPAATAAAWERGAKIILFEGEPFESSDGTSYPVGLIRHAEATSPHVGELVKRVAVFHPLDEEVDRWYIHPAGFFAGRGTRKAPRLEPVEIDIGLLARLLDETWVR